MKEENNEIEEQITTKVLSPKAGANVWDIARNSDINTPILNFLLNLQKKGKSNSTIRVEDWTLQHLNKHANLNDPKTVEEYITSLQRSNNYKHKIAATYSQFCRIYQIQWKQPYYPKNSKSIRIPTSEKLEMLISYAGKLMGTKLQLSKETGLRPIEVHSLEVKDIDITQ